jgi:hypothetical protein
MKDLKLKVGDKCYIGGKEYNCVKIDDSDMPYFIKAKYELGFWVCKDGRIMSETPQIVSLEPYDLPEMVYEKPLEIGKPHYFWNCPTYVEYGILLTDTPYREYRYESVNDYHKFCSPTPPDLTIK